MFIGMGREFSTINWDLVGSFLIRTSFVLNFKVLLPMLNSLQKHADFFSVSHLQLFMSNLASYKLLPCINNSGQEDSEIFTQIEIHT